MSDTADELYRLEAWIKDNVPDEAVPDANIVDTAVRLLARHYGPDAQPSPLRFDRPISDDEAARIAEAVRKAAENPGRTVLVDDAWKGFPLEGDEVQR